MSSPFAALLPHPPPIESLAPELRDTVARYRVELDEGSSVDLFLDHGQLSVESTSGDPDCVLSCAGDLLGHVLHGEANLLTAFLRGDVRVKKGNLEIAKRLYRFLHAAREGGAGHE
jgi:putative sterol carrier protein